MSRERAWTIYFTTGDREPLVKAYWKSIKTMVFTYCGRDDEDLFQVALMGLLKAIKRIDHTRVKSKDKWVWLNVRGAMLNMRQFKPTVSLNNLIAPHDEYSDTHLDSLEAKPDEVDFDLWIKDLPARQRLILSLIYRHDWHKTEIGRLLNISSMRVSQIEQQALKVLRTGGEVVNASL